MYIYFFFPFSMLCFVLFFLWGRGQVGLLVLIYDNYLRYSTSILVLYYIYLHIIYISYNFRVCSRSRCANGKTTQYGLSMWKSKEKTRKEPGPHPFQVTFSVNLHFPSGSSSGRAHKRPVASLKGLLGRHLNYKLFLIGTIYRPTEPS